MLNPGARLGAYEIVRALGAGGMGEVYRARDARLNRDVAIKVLPPAVAADPDRLARFRREAQTLAALNHPNIAQIHGLEEIDGLPDGGMHPTWSRTRHELFYGTDDGQIMSVPTAVDGDAFRAGKPRPWADGRLAARVSRTFDLHPDGERFAIAPAQDLAPPGGDRLTLVLNVFDELRRLAPAGKP